MAMLVKWNIKCFQICLIHDLMHHKHNGYKDDRTCWQHHKKWALLAAQLGVVTSILLFPTLLRHFVIISGWLSVDMNLTSFVSFHTVQVKFESREDWNVIDSPLANLPSFRILSGRYFLKALAVLTVRNCFKYRNLAVTTEENRLSK